MTDAATHELIRQHEGILLEHPEKGVLVSDRLGRRFYGSVSRESESPLPTVRILELLSYAQDMGMDAKDKERLLRIQSTLSLTVFISEEAFHNAGTAETVSRLLEMRDHIQVTLILGLPEGPSSWESLWQFLDVVRAVKHVSLKISLQGRFACNDEVKERLVRYGVVVRWPLGLAGEASVDEAQLNIIRDFSEFGIPVLFMLYVGRHNVQSAKDLLRLLLPVGLYSGFSVLPVFQHPEFAYSCVEDSQCDAGEYLALLIDLYKEFPYYDGLCFPINELADSVAFGGWNEELHTPRFMQMAILGDGAIRLFRHIPALAFHWINCDAVLNMSKESLQDAFLSVLASHLGKQNQKEDCQLLSICACTDGITCERNSASRYVCHYRSMFIEAFLWQKYMLQQVIEERSHREQHDAMAEEQVETGAQQSLITG